MTIKKLIDKYNADRKYYLTNKYNETLLRSDFLDPFFELLGWDIKNNAGKPTNEREVILEEALKENASEHSKKPDYTFRLFSERKFFLEAKKPCVAIESNNDSANQVFADKTTYTCLLILNKKPQKTFQYAEVKSLKSWKVREPNAVKYATKYTNQLDNEVLNLGVPLRVGLSATIFLPCGTKRIFASIPNANAA